MAFLAGHLFRGCLLYPQKKHVAAAEVVGEGEVEVSGSSGEFSSSLVSRGSCGVSHVPTVVAFIGKRGGPEDSDCFWATSLTRTWSEAV